MIKTEYNYLDANMNPVAKEQANMLEIVTKEEDGTIVESKLIIISG